MAITTNNVRMFGVAGTPINFSGLATAFKLDDPLANQNNGLTPTPISASQILRNVAVDAGNYTEPYVPDAIENVGIASTPANLNLSQFRNTIKYFTVYQTGFNTSRTTLPAIEMSGIWSGNLSKNITKILSIGGTVGSIDQQIPAIQLSSSQAFNLIVDVAGNTLPYSSTNPGKIYGSGGNPGITTNDPNGKAGGDAISVTSTGNNVRVRVKEGSVVYGGGGGGGKGATGRSGSLGVCYYYNYYTRNSGCEFYGNCGQYDNVSVVLNGTTYNTYGATQIGGNNGQGGCQCWGWGGSPPCSRTNISDAQCRKTDPFLVQGAPGGIGGNGVKGRGWDNFTAALNTVGTGAPGTAGGCGDVDNDNNTPPNYGGTGNDGSNGSNGGDWGQVGTDGKQASTATQYNVIPGIRGTGGAAGRAVGGTKFQVLRTDGESLPDTNILKGTFQ